MCSVVCAQTGRPLELGAEFVHGAPKSLLSLLHEHDEPFEDVVDAHHFVRNSRLTEIKDFWGELEQITNRISMRGADQSVAEFLARRRFPRSTKMQMFQSFVEGFQAADMSLMSAQDLKGSQAGADDELNGSNLFRLSHGYGSLLKHWLEARPQLSSRLRMHQQVQSIDYSGRVVRVRTTSRLTGGSQEWVCRNLVVALPLGVLKVPSESPGGLTWLPRKPSRLESALRGLEMGHVQRMTLTFRERFWEDFGGNLKPAFFHLGPEFYFPTWWSLLPVRSPHLVAWQGGPKALEMSGWSAERKLGQALESLRRLSGFSFSKLESLLVGSASHDWSQDEFSRGAYSYVVKNGRAASERLRRSGPERIWFAGEAAAAGADRGTVHGALDSGRRAAQSILKS